MSMTVLRISFTESRALSHPAMPPHTAPAKTPTTMVSGNSAAAGQFGSARATAAPASDPAIICPSPPMLRIPLRNEMMIPRPISRSGVALTRLSVMPYLPLTGPVNIALYAVTGSARASKISPAPTKSARTRAPTSTPICSRESDAPVCFFIRSAPLNDTWRF